MGLNPGKFQLLKAGVISAPGGASTPAILWGKNQPFLVQGVRALVTTAATGSTTLKIQSDTDVAFGTAVDLGTITVTSGDAAGSSFEVLVADASKDRAKTDYIRLRHSGADASLVLQWELFGTPAID